MPTRSGRPVSLRLWLGKQVSAWLDYPSARRRLDNVPPGPAILITGTPRSGTTWVAKMLAESGLWYVREPFNPNNGLWQEEFTYVDGQEKRKAVDRIMRGLLRGKYRQTSGLPWTEHRLMPLRLLPQPVNRVLIKDPIACLLSRYLTRRFDLETLVLFRHPAGFAASIRRLRWPCAPVIRQFLACEPLMAKWLRPYRHLMERVAGKEGIEAAAVLHGCLNTVLWGYVQESGRMRRLVFEDLCDSPIQNFRRIFEDLGLPYDERVRRSHMEFCFAEKPGRTAYRPHNVRRLSRSMASRWRGELGVEQVKRIRSIWMRFAIPLYRSDGDW